MSATTSLLARMSVGAAPVGVASAVAGLIRMPIAHADELTCSDGLVASEGTCVPPADGPAAPEAAQGPFSAPESSLDDPSLFTPPFELTEGEVASPGYNAGGGGHR